MKIVRLIIVLILSFSSFKLSAQFNEKDIEEIIMFNLQETVKKLIIDKKSKTKNEAIVKGNPLWFHDKYQKSKYDTFRLHAYIPSNINDTIFEGRKFVAFRFEEEYYINTKDSNDSFSNYNDSMGASFLSTYLISYQYSYATLRYTLFAYSGNMLKHEIWYYFYQNRELTIATIMSYLKIRCYSLLINDIQFVAQKDNVYTFNLQLQYEKAGKWQLKFDVNNPNNPSLYVDDELFRGEW